MKELCRIITLVYLVSVVTVSSFGQEITAKQERQIKSIAKQIDKSVRYFDSKRHSTSAKELGKAYDRLMKLAADADEALIAAIEPEYKRIGEYHAKLKAAGLELSDLAELPEPIVSESGGTSFVNEIAPILVQRCGRCHVNQSRGEFSAKTFDALMASTHVSPGRPDTSRLIEVIEEGSMPPNGNVPDNQLKSLKLWIRLGAKFDGQNPGQSIGTAARNRPGNRSMAEKPSDSIKPTGSETVSFGRDVAPILIENCSGCHIGGRQIRGNLNMANFARMMRGGDSGTPISAGNPGTSLIVKRLRGIDSTVMPPRRKLREADIKTIETWITEGAKYDGQTTRTEIATVAAVAATNSKSHSSVVAERDKLAEKNWKLIMSSSDSEVHSTKNLRVLGATAREQVALLAEEVVADLSKTLGLRETEPFVKGNVSIYLFEKRYDLNELGMMLVNREIPKNQIGRWDFTTVDAYASMLLPQEAPIEDVKPFLSQQLAAIWVTSKSSGTPRWFADAAGYLLAAKLDRKNKLVRQWQTNAVEVSQGLEDPKAFARGKLSEREAGLAGYVFIQGLKKGGALKSLMSRISSGEPFDTAFAAVMGQTPDEYFKPVRRRRR